VRVGKIAAFLAARHQSLTIFRHFLSNLPKKENYYSAITMFLKCDGANAAMVAASVHLFA
jgi:hypothetical protein